MTDDGASLESKLRELELFTFQRSAEPDEDLTGRLAYRATCDKLDKESFFRFPIDSVLDKFDKADLDLSHCGLGDKGVQALAEALKINTSITSLNLLDNHLTPAGGDALVGALMTNKNVKSLNLAENRLGSQALAPLSGATFGTVIRQLLSKNSTIQDLCLRANRIADRDMELIAEGVVDNVTITSLDLSYNELGPRGGAAVANLLAHGSADLRELNLEWNQLRHVGTVNVLRDGLIHTGTVRKFNIAWNGVDDEGGEILGEVIRGSSVLEELDVSNNRIGQKGAEAIARGVAESTTLLRLMLNDNPLRDAGCAAVIRALRDNRTVTRIDLRATDAGKLATEELQETLKVKNEQFQIEVPRSLFMPTEW